MLATSSSPVMPGDRLGKEWPLRQDLAQRHKGRGPANERACLFYCPRTVLYYEKIPIVNATFNDSETISVGGEMPRVTWATVARSPDRP